MQSRSAFGMLCMHCAVQYLVFEFERVGVGKVIMTVQASTHDDVHEMIREHVTR